MRPPRFAPLLLVASLAFGCKPDDTDTEDTDTEGTDTDTAAPAFTCPGDDPNEPDDALGTATPLADGVHQDGIICENDADWYSFTAPPGCLAAATLKLGPDAGDLDLVLYDALQQPLDGSLFGESVEEVEWFNRTGLAQALYLEVTGYLGDDGTYAIKYTCTASDCAGDEASEPDAPDDPNALAADTSFAGKICHGDSDWFELPLGAGCDVAILLDYAVVSGDLDLFLYDAAGAPLDASQSSDDDDELSWSSDGADTTLLVEVFGVDLANTTYALSFTEACPFTCPEDDANEPDDTFADPTPLADGVEQQGIVCTTDADWYSFSAPPGCLAAATLTFGPGAGDLDLVLYDDQQAKLDESLFGVAVEEVGWFNRTASAQALFLEVTGYLAAEGSYAIEYSCTASTCDGDEAGEPDSPPDDANALTADTPSHGKICYGDSDWFVIDVDAGCDLDILLDYAYLGGDLDLYVYDVDLLLVGSSTSGDDDEEFGFENGRADTSLFVEVRGHDLANNTYALSYTAQCPATCPADDAHEPDDTQALATALADRVPQGGVVCIADSDWYRFTAPPGCLAATVLAQPSSPNDLDLEMFDAAGALIEGSYSGVLSEELLFYNLTGAPEELFFRVFGWQGAEENYSIVSWCVEATCEEDPGEPDAMSDARLLTAEAPFEGRLCYNDSDWFEIQVAADQQCVVDVLLDFAHADSDLELFLYNEAGTLVDGSTTSDDDEEILGIHAQGESLFLEVLASGLADSDYAVSYTADCVEVCVDLPDADDTGLTATPLAGPTTIEGQICVGDADWYTFTVGTGCVVDFTLDEVSADLDMLLYDRPDAHPLGFVSRDGATTQTPEELRITNAGPPKDFWLWVYAFGQASESDYTLTYEAACIDCGEVTEDDNQAQAVDLPPVGEVSSTACGDEDWYVIVTTAGCDIDVDLELETTNADADVHLLDATATLVASGVESGVFESILYTNNVAGGTYYLKVVPFSGIAQYHLKWNEVDCP